MKKTAKTTALAFAAVTMALVTLTASATAAKPLKVTKFATIERELKGGETTTVATSTPSKGIVRFDVVLDADDSILRPTMPSTVKPTTNESENATNAESASRPQVDALAKITWAESGAKPKVVKSGVYVKVKEGVKTVTIANPNDFKVKAKLSVTFVPDVARTIKPGKTYVGAVRKKKSSLLKFKVTAKKAKYVFRVAGCWQAQILDSRKKVVRRMSTRNRQAFLNYSRDESGKITRTINLYKYEPGTFPDDAYKTRATLKKGTYYVRLLNTETAPFAITFEKTK